MKATKPAERQVNRGLHLVGVSHTRFYEFCADLREPEGLTQIGDYNIAAKRREAFYGCEPQP